MVTAAPGHAPNLLSTEGYFAAETTARIDGAAAVPLVRIRVRPSVRTTVATLDLQIHGPVVTKLPAQAMTMRDHWPLKPGTPFRQDDRASSRRRALSTLRRRRYADATMDSAQARINPDISRDDLAALYDSRPTFFLGGLAIEGTQRYPTQIIRNISSLQVSEILDSERLLALQRAIQQAPYFSNAVVDVVRDRTQAATAPVAVRVTEFPTQQLRGGAGYTTDTGAHVNGVHSHNNLFGRAWVLES